MAVWRLRGQDLLGRVLALIYYRAWVCIKKTEETMGRGIFGIFSFRLGNLFFFGRGI